MPEIIARNGNELTIQVTVKLSGSLMEMENTVLDCCNEVGGLATQEALQEFDDVFIVSKQRFNNVTAD